MKDDSFCKKESKILCLFEIERDLTDALVVVCHNCGKRVVYHKDRKGNLDDTKYQRDHLRDILQPFGRTKKLFLQIYGEEWIKEVKKKFPKKKDFGSWEDVWKEARKFVTRKVI